MVKLTAEKAWIFRIVHRDNVPWILDHGLHSRNSSIADPNYINIGNLELIDRRHHSSVPCPPGGTLGDYIPFYFTPFSPMLFNIKTGWGGIRKRSNDEIVILTSTLHALKKKDVRFIFTDRHAYLKAAKFFSDLADLDEIDWTILQNRDFKKDPDDLGKFERYQAEALIHKHLPCDGLLGMVCYSDSVAETLTELVQERGLDLQIAARRNWYF
jgi:hypothetical protein